MKKVLSVLLAVCLFATLLVPAFAAIPDFGKLADVAKVEFDKTQYKLDDITKDGIQVDVTALLTCWDSNGNRTNFDASGLTASEIRAYWTSNDAVLAINETTGRIDRIKNNLSTDQKIQLRVTLASGKQATTTILVPSNKAEASKDAYGFRVKNIEFQEGHFLNGNGADRATLTWTAPKLTAQTSITINGTANNVAAGEAAAVAEAVRTAWATLTINGVDYAVKAKTSDTDAVVVWETAVTGALDAAFIPAASDLEVLGAPSAKGTIANTAAGTDGTKGTWTSAITAVTTAVNGDVVTLNGTDYTVPGDVTIANLTGATSVAAWVAGKLDAAMTDFDVTAATGTITFTQKVASTTAAAPTYTFAKKSGTFAVTTGNITAGTAAVAPVKETFTFTPVAMSGNKSLKLGETSFAFNGNETAAMVVTALDGKNVTIKGIEYKLVKNGAALDATAVTGGVVTDRPATADITLGGAGDDALTFTNGNNAGTGNAVVYNVGDEITPVLSSYAFTGDQKNSFTFAVRTANMNNSHKIEVGAAPVKAYGLEFQMGVDGNGVPALLIGQDRDTDYNAYKGTYVYVRVLNDKFSNAQTEKEFSIKLVGAPGETEKVLPAEAYVGVGQVLDLTTLSKSVDGVKTYWSVGTYGNYQTPKTAGMTAKIIMETVDGDGDAYGWTVKGLAPGVVTIALRNAKNGGIVDTMKLNVGAGSPATPTPSTANATVKVNEQVKLSVKNLNSDEYVKWSIDNNNVSLANYDGAAATVYGKKEGTAVVTAKVYESKAAANDGKDPVNTFKINVTVKAAESKPVTTPNTTAPTANPQTGDSIFANLF